MYRLRDYDAFRAQYVKGNGIRSKMVKTAKIDDVSKFGLINNIVDSNIMHYDNSLLKSWQPRKTE
jgi:hypothetical protein